jgi:hypothetical protein
VDVSRRTRPKVQPLRWPLLLVCLSVLCLTACKPAEVDHEFMIRKVVVTPVYQGISASFRQSLQLSQQARDALEHGVELTIRFDMDLREAGNLMRRAVDSRRFVIRYLPMSRRYELNRPGDLRVQTFSRLRHLLNELGSVNLRLATGPLTAGEYELRVRVQMDKRRLPAPLRLPAWLSAQWQHDSEWSTWPFDIGA